MTGSWTLPVIACLALVLWMLPDVTSVQLWGGLALTGVVTYVVMELNNRFQLLRIRSRMMSSTFHFLTLLCPALHVWHPHMLSLLCYALSYALLFASYQQVRPEGYVYHAFLLLGLGSLLFPPLLVAGVGYWVSMLFQLRVMSWRSVAASLLGVLTPFWLWVVWLLWHGGIEPLPALFMQAWPAWPPSYSALTLPQLITAGTVAFYLLLAFIYLRRNAYNDKIRTRMLIYVIVTQEVLLLAGMLLLPQAFLTQFHLFLFNSSLLIAHHMSLARGRLFDLWFYLSLLLLVALGVFNYLCHAGWLPHVVSCHPLQGITLCLPSC